MKCPFCDSNFIIPNIYSFPKAWYETNGLGAALDFTCGICNKQFDKKETVQ